MLPPIPAKPIRLTTVAEGVVDEAEPEDETFPEHHGKSIPGPLALPEQTGGSARPSKSRRTGRTSRFWTCGWPAILRLRSVNGEVSHGPRSKPD